MKHAAGEAGYGKKRDDVLLERKRLLKEGRYQAAHELESDWLASFPADAAMHHMSAWTLSAMQKPEKALQHLQEADALEPLNPKYNEALARAYERAAARVRSRSSSSHKEEEARIKDRQVATLKQSLATVLPTWIHATNQSTRLHFEEDLRRHRSDSVPEWIQFAPQPLEQGAIVDFGAIGRFVVGNPRQVIHKRLSRNIPWELPNAVLLMELASRCDPRSLVFDVGANVGTLTVPLGKAFAGSIIAFEPVPRNHFDLQANLSLNNLKNVTVLNKACSREPGMGEMGHLAENNPGTAQLDTSIPGDTEVTTLDIVAAGRPVGLIKMDVEGHEPDVISGARHILTTHRPLILSELLGFQADNIKAALLDFGYDCVNVHRRDWLFFPAR